MYKTKIGTAGILYNDVHETYTIMWCGPLLIPWEKICVFPVNPYIIMKITLSNACLWLKSHTTAKGKVLFYLLGMFQHMNSNEPGGKIITA